MSIIKKTIAAGAVVVILTIILVSWDDPKYEGLTESQIEEIKLMEEECDVLILQQIIEIENVTSVEDECNKAIEDQIAKFRALNKNP